MNDIITYAEVAAIVGLLPVIALTVETVLANMRIERVAFDPQTNSRVIPSEPVVV